jgi:hypothetical protein
MTLFLVLSWTLLATANAGRTELYRIDSDDVGGLRGGRKQRHNDNNEEQRGRKRDLKKKKNAKKNARAQNTEVDLEELNQRVNNVEMEVLFDTAELDFMVRFSLSMSMTSVSLFSLELYNTVLCERHWN